MDVETSPIFFKSFAFQSVLEFHQNSREIDRSRKRICKPQEICNVDFISRSKRTFHGMFAAVVRPFVPARDGWRGILLKMSVKWRIATEGLAYCMQMLISALSHETLQSVAWWTNVMYASWASLSLAYLQRKRDKNQLFPFFAGLVTQKDKGTLNVGNAHGPSEL